MIIYGVARLHNEPLLFLSFNAKAFSVVMVNRLPLLLLIFLSGFLSGQSFQDVSEALEIHAAALDAKLMAGGVVWFDYNGDRYPDLLFVNGDLPAKLYRNDWNGKFTDVTESAGLLGTAGTMGAVSADFDVDGHQDLFFTTLAGTPNRLFRNNGAGRFTDVSLSVGISHSAYSASASVGDPDNDGDPDIYVANYLAGEEPMDGGQPNFFYRNDGSGNFEEVAAVLGIDNNGCGLGATFTDINSDGREDLYVANDYGYLVQANELFRNEGGTYRATANEDGSAATINAMGIAKGDYDNDGDQDLYITNIRENPLFENVGDGDFFRYVAIPAGVALPELTSWGTAFADFDLDGLLDLVVANGQVAETENDAEPMAYFKNEGDGTFRSIPGIQEVSLMGRGLAVADYDLDGLQDVAVNAVSPVANGPERARLLRNTSSAAGRWLAVESPFSARRMELHAGGKTLYREKDGGSSYLSHSSGPLHFGMETIEEIDSLVVHFNDGSRLSYYDLAWGNLVGVEQEGNWYSVRHSSETICANEAAEPVVSQIRVREDTGAETLLISRTETVAYTTEPLKVVEIYSGEEYQGVAHTQDAMIVDTIASASACPVLQPIDIRILPEVEALTMYPNPAGRDIVIALTEAVSAIKLELFTITGQLAHSQDIEFEESLRSLPVTLPKLPAGEYLCRLTHQEEITIHKLIIR
ncbi:FG-GAP-like repeat-containing protein [Neolewinella agarilytica]|uniref:Por secretion system C-terminal sorting domain-containing protein n=1 Tax=Neolewinella agarilytica TaxID=478744 RepID=A0A1H9D1M6_9BACT|nr:FG-GAP-like repeat-containing protein [Neolewinella agarilytica]SEQ06668.1 Por secretion system C-terminal sorting domain-containing protein [Neolewinella agarilytica]